MDLVKLQREHKAWLDREFPVQPTDVPAAGMVEEAGELLHCALALRRHELWGDDARYPMSELRADLVDAVGDCAIYCVSYCNSAGLPFSLAAPVLCSTPLRTCVNLVRIAASTEGRSLVSLYTGHLQGAAQQLGADFESAVEVTWRKVSSRRRDRPARPVKVCLCGSSFFKDEYLTAVREETLAGRIVLPMGLLGHHEGLDMDGPVKRMLDELHLRKIDESDEILVVDPETWVCTACGKRADRPSTACCGAVATRRSYVGSSTRSEIEYAQKGGKRIRYWSQERRAE